MKWIIVLLTWFAAGPSPISELENTPGVEVRRQELPAGRTKSDCDAMMKRVSKDWADAYEEYGFAMNCQLNPEPDKPKGQRK